MEKYSLRNKSTQTNNDIAYKEAIEHYFQHSSGTINDKLNSFSRFVSRQTLSIFLAKHEIFKKIINIQGNIIECGVFAGGGLFTWAQLSTIYEPVNHCRKIIGFDTFDGFPNLTEKDNVHSGSEEEHKILGAYRFDAVDELLENIKLFDLNRSIGHIPKIELIKGDATVSIPEYLKENSHLVIALLYLDFDIYEPTKTALEYFLPRMPKGSILAFDELNQKQWPGETIAVLEEIGLRKIKIQRFSYTPAISFAVLD